MRCSHLATGGECYTAGARGRSRRGLALVGGHRRRRRTGRPPTVGLTSCPSPCSRYSLSSDPHLFPAMTGLISPAVDGALARAPAIAANVFFPPIRSLAVVFA
ncbi:hypothetical protein GUJ93_ZPchr0458g22283 [Zizania palustris]|uniref:Uncharacterized protein n=1 Tax=Zizania palustris TaxID=103762 RepID=A0A8J5UUL8_ZIZPA|nr:hypothetical protein GUJ93_ZPchr0458g22283 [Zizania palustris]